MIQSPKASLKEDNVDHEVSKEFLIETRLPKPKSINFFGNKKKVDVFKNKDDIRGLN